jgi:hypothetical protein
MQRMRRANRATRTPAEPMSGAVATAGRRPVRGSRWNAEVDQSDEGALAFIGDVLLGETGWSMDEVTKLLALHTLVAVGRAKVVGLDDAGRATR